MAALIREEIAALILARLPDNAARFISPARLRDVVSAIADSVLFAGEAASAEAVASAIAAATSACATAAQGAKADSAVQPAAQASAIASAIAAAASAYATAAQGAKADSAVQPDAQAAAIAAALAADADARASITSGSVRAQLMIGSGGTYAGGERATHRQRDRTNVAIDRPWFEFLHGRVISTGAVDQELEAGIASGVTAKYRAAVLIGISGTGKNQSSATVTRLTFRGMAGVAGCTVSGDGYTITVPNGVRFRSDRTALALTAGQEYFVQTECVAADGSVAPESARPALHPDPRRPQP